LNIFCWGCLFFYC